ncbi:MAG: nuclear transport factor 2 family protein [Thermoleophilaceae bacterium]|nr:nuclear transport factor 2 family protein [Thermoleophilaceae bacterium]
MARENVEIVRRLYETGAVDRAPELLRDLLDDDAVWINPPEAVEPGTRRGAAEVLEALDNLSRSFETAEHTVRELFDAGDAVVASVTFHARGRDSGAELAQDEAHTWTFRNGRVVSFEWGRDLPAALDAVGLSAPSREHVELLNRWRESWSRQDGEGTVACLHDDVVIDFTGARGPFRGVYSGPVEVLGLLSSMWEAWHEARIEFAEVIDCGGGRLLTVNLFQAQGKSSGIHTVAKVANLWTFRDGLIHRARLFQTKDEALRAAGRAE